jgi:integrase
VKALLTFWRAKKVSDITEETCAEYVRHRAGRSKSTISRELSMLAAALHLDKKKGRLSETVHVWKPGEADPRDIWLTRREAAILLWHSRKTQAKNYLPVSLLFLLYTSPRKTAALTLRWPQVDFRRGLIDFNPPGRQQTKKGRPIIPIPAKILPFLRYQRRKGTELGFVFNRNGKPLGDIRKGVDGAAEQAAKYCEKLAAEAAHELERQDWMESARRLRATTPHVLRHTCITWLAQADVPFGAIARYAGHKSSRTTEKVYAHHSPSYLKQVTAALDRRR